MPHPCGTLHFPIIRGKDASPPMIGIHLHIVLLPSDAKRYISFGLTWEQLMSFYRLLSYPPMQNRIYLPSRPEKDSHRKRRGSVRPLRIAGTTDMPSSQRLPNRFPFHTDTSHQYSLLLSSGCFLSLSEEVIEG